METPSELQTKTSKVGLLSASTRSFFARNQPLAGAGQETVNGGIIRNEVSFEEPEQIRGSQRGAIVMENTYRMAPDPQKKFSPGKFLLLITKYVALFQCLIKIFCYREVIRIGSYLISSLTVDLRVIPKVIMQFYITSSLHCATYLGASYFLLKQGSHETKE